jgi:hypothetical protein
MPKGGFVTQGSNLSTALDVDAVLCFGEQTV